MHFRILAIEKKNGSGYFCSSPYEHLQELFEVELSLHKLAHQTLLSVASASLR